MGDLLGASNKPYEDFQHYCSRKVDNDMKIVFTIFLILNVFTEALAAISLIGGPDGITAAGKGNLWSMHYGFAALAIASASLWIWPYRRRHQRALRPPSHISLMLPPSHLLDSVPLQPGEAPSPRSPPALLTASERRRGRVLVCAHASLKRLGRAQRLRARPVGPSTSTGSATAVGAPPSRTCVLSVCLSAVSAKSFCTGFQC